MRVTIDGVGTFDVSEVALPQLLRIINSNRGITIPANENRTANNNGVQLINE